MPGILRALATSSTAVQGLSWRGRSPRRADRCGRGLHVGALLVGGRWRSVIR